VQKHTPTPEPRRLGPAEFGELADALLRDGDAVRFRAFGGSMAPLIPDGATVTVAPVAPCAVRRGDVVLYRRESGTVAAHRVVRIPDASQAGFVVASDVGLLEPETVTASQILGRVRRVGAGRRTRGRRVLRDAARRTRARLCVLRVRYLGRGK